MSSLPPAARSGFTLLEALIAAVLLMMILGIMATIWQNAYRSVTRTRSILVAHQKARAAMDQAESMLLERSGAMPLVAQENSTGPAWPFKLGTWQSRVHIDCTSISTTTSSTREDVNGNGARDSTDVDLNGDGDIGDTFTGRWSSSSVNGAWVNDPYAAGKDIGNATIGDNGWNWGMGRRLLWHSSVTRFDTSRTFMVTDPSAKPTPQWSYYLVHNLDYGRQGKAAMNGYWTGNNLPWIQHSGWWWQADRRFSPDSITTTQGFSAYGTDIYGAYRGLTVVPYQHRSGGTTYSTPWLGLTHVYRINSGPTFFRELWSNGQWRVQKTGNYGSSTGVTSGVNVTVNPYDPDWNFIKTWAVNATDPALSTADRPTYGAIITDNGGVQWRCEAPKLMLWDSVGFPQQQGAIRARTLVNGRAWNPVEERYSNLQTRNTLVVRYGSNDAYGLQQNGQDVGASALNGNMLGSVTGSNYSRFRIRTARLVDDWPTPSPATWQPNQSSLARDAARGKWGCLSLPGWWYNSNNTIARAAPSIVERYTEGVTAGFPGAAPSGEEAPSHPWWTSVEVGVVGGLDAAGREAISRPFELAFTYALVLR